MPHVVTRSCCADASCTFACPVNCIHPTPDEPDFGTAEMLYIDPVSCVDCGACVRACPVGAIVPHTKLGEHELPFLEINAAFHNPPRSYPPQAPVPAVVDIRSRAETLRVAVVGAGPAAMYAADELLKQADVEVSVLDRLPTPYGLVRAGVAPDHPDTRSVTRVFGQVEAQRGFSYHLGVEVGSDLGIDEVLAHHHAVIVATGASRDRSLGIPGEDLPGSETATDVVAWYNGHPDHAHRDIDLSADRAVVVGNGNVALDVARILATDPERLAGTDIADPALDRLRASRVREVVVLGRRGPAQAAFTVPELVSLVSRDDIDVVVDDPGGLAMPDDADLVTRQKIEALRAVPAPRGEGRRRVVLRFCASPVALEGDGRVERLQVVRNRLEPTPDGGVRAVADGEPEPLETSLVLRSVGYRSIPVAGVPFDEQRAVVPNLEGRVLDGPDGGHVRGLYAAGWIKRGPSGFIGTNKSCSLETVNHLLEDFLGGRLPAPTGSARAFDRLVTERFPDAIDLAGWRRIERAERENGAAAGRVARRFTDRADLRVAAAAPRRQRRSLIR
ncbi:4Fe-4S binding domain protein [Aeromicrobium marinum DSM 15272]|uniref:ferredoxin--NADP(+) reductase n=1 Tax=Aeromicrobium marinum DSM 15272 TaxID=585531 RepID=E2S9D2_9ACTN|nr:FAD-dependent oxidoreductase [Aeromicrobium marinum]EFQ83856.1 4Fe-4S binding domain protein [Aeromicrobium marinum DSM 15272]